MKKLIPIVLLTLLITGCGRKAEQTQAVKVANPVETLPPAATAPAPAPTTPAPPAMSVAKDGSVTLKSGLKYKDKKIGKGAEVTSNTRVTVHYKGWLDNGKVFDTSKKPGREPFQFTVGNGDVIKGWDEGVAGMKVGGVRELTIPPSLGYGDEEQVGIPPNSTLHFTVELLSIR